MANAYKTYTVTATQITYMHCKIRARSRDEAMDKAYDNMDIDWDIGNSDIEIDNAHEEE